MVQQVKAKEKIKLLTHPFLMTLLCKKLAAEDHNLLSCNTLTALHKQFISIVTHQEEKLKMKTPTQMIVSGHSRKL